MSVRISRASSRINLRMLVGIILIAVSAVSVWGLIRATSSSSSIVVATKLLVEGQQIRADDVRTDSTGSGVDLGQYLDSSALAVGKVVTRVIRPGEFVPKASVGEVSETLETTLVIDVATEVASDLQDGSIVDVWAAPARTSVSPAATSVAPRIVMHRARLARREVAAASSMSGSRVEVVLPRDAVGEVLAAIAQGDAMMIVASSGGLNS